jgi:hypothetical protein
VGYVFFLHRITLLATGDGLLSAAADFRPAGNILTILPARAKLFSEAWLILSKNLFKMHSTKPLSSQRIKHIDATVDYNSVT